MRRQLCTLCCYCSLCRCCCSAAEPAFRIPCSAGGAQGPSRGTAPSPRAPSSRPPDGRSGHAPETHCHAVLCDPSMHTRDAPLPGPFRGVTRVIRCRAVPHAAPLRVACAACWCRPAACPIRTLSAPGPAQSVACTFVGHDCRSRLLDGGCSTVSCTCICQIYSRIPS